MIENLKQLQFYMDPTLAQIYYASITIKQKEL